MRYHLTLVWMAINKKTKTTGVGEDVEKLEPLHTANRYGEWYSHYGKWYWVPQKTKDRTTI